MSVGFTGFPWNESMLDRESHAFTSFTENLSNNVRVSCGVLFMRYHSITIVILIIRKRGEEEEEHSSQYTTYIRFFFILSAA